jgi:predicted Fe-Mo cluster-binding NifX family protein
MRIAIPTEDGNIFQHFGHSKEFTLYDIENEMVQQKQVVATNGAGHGALADFLTVHSVNMVISGNIGGGAKTALREKNIELIPGVTGKADDIIIRYLSGEELGNPNTECNHHSHDGGHTCGNHGCGSH